MVRILEALIKLVNQINVILFLYRFNRIVTQQNNFDIIFENTFFKNESITQTYIKYIYNRINRITSGSDTTVGSRDTKRSEKLNFYHKPEPRIHVIRLTDLIRASRILTIDAKMIKIAGRTRGGSHR